MQSATVTAAKVEKKREIVANRWITPPAEVKMVASPSQNVYPARSRAAQLGSIGLDRYFDNIDPKNTMFSKHSTPSTSAPQSAFPAISKALRLLKR